MIAFKKIFKSLLTKTDPFPTETEIMNAMTKSNKAYQAMMSSTAIGSYNITQSAQMSSGTFQGLNNAFSKQATPTSVISLYKITGSPIVKLNVDGTVDWANGIDVDAAAEAFGRSLVLSSEQRAGITQRVKLSMRDSVFNDLIDIAKEKGSLTAEDLTYLLEASKIVEKLKGED